MKLSPLTIILIGVSILIMALSYGFFQHYLPNTQEAGFYRTYSDQLQAEGDKLTSAEDRLKKAKDLVTTKAAEWRAVVSTKTPNPDVAARGINISVDPYQLTVDSKKFRDNIQRAVNAQMIKGGVKVVSPGPEIPMPSDNAGDILTFYNYPTIAFPVVIFDLGSITVEGTEAQIMENVRAWKNMPRYLAVADGLQITGTSPNLRGTYSVTVVGFIRGTQVFADPPAPPAGGAAGGPGGGFGGAPGGAPGRPGMSGPSTMGMGGPGGPGGRGGFGPPTR
jgi:hypothetical protein